MKKCIIGLFSKIITFLVFAFFFIPLTGIAFYFALKSDANLFRIGWALCLPLVSIVLNVLAIRAIGRDEVMVKAADRLR